MGTDENSETISVFCLQFVGEVAVKSAIVAKKASGRWEYTNPMHA